MGPSSWTVRAVSDGGSAVCVKKRDPSLGLAPRSARHLPPTDMGLQRNYPDLMSERWGFGVRQSHHFRHIRDLMRSASRCEIDIEKN